MKHTAKRIKAGEYIYRGFKVECVGYLPGNGGNGWEAIDTDGTAFGQSFSFAETKIAIDDELHVDTLLSLGIEQREMDMQGILAPHNGDYQKRCVALFDRDWRPKFKKAKTKEEFHAIGNEMQMELIDETNRFVEKPSPMFLEIMFMVDDLKKKVN